MSGMKKFSIGGGVITPKYLINTKCALLDMCTANFIKSTRTGHVVVNGGTAQHTSVVGPPNAFKSRIANFYSMSAYRAITLGDALHTQNFTYDSEVNMSITFLAHLMSRVVGRTVTTEELEEIWDISDKTLLSGDEWVAQLRELSRAIIKEDTKLDWYLFGTKEKPHMDYVARLMTLDSLTELTPTITDDTIDKATKEDSSTNMVFMKMGMFKTKFMSELPKLITRPNIRFFSTAHLTPKIEMDPNAKYKQPTKDLMFLKDGETIKGVSSKYLFLTSIVFSASKATKLINKTDKLPEYPSPTTVTTNVDLQVVHLQVLRNKHGASGVILPIVTPVKMLATRKQV